MRSVLARRASGLATIGPRGGVRRVLGIETSCDDTGVAIVSSERKILGQCLNSQWDLCAFVRFVLRLWCA